MSQEYQVEAEFDFFHKKINLKENDKITDNNKDDEASSKPLSFFSRCIVAFIMALLMPLVMFYVVQFGIAVADRVWDNAFKGFGSHELRHRPH
jgi:hypothetical protein